MERTKSFPYFFVEKIIYSRRSNYAKSVEAKKMYSNRDSKGTP